MTKLLIGLLGAGVIATGGYAAATSVDADPARTVSLPAATSTDATSPASAPARGTTTADDEDVSGPCDEADHANDPRCTDGAAAGDEDHADDDRSGHGSGGSDDDRSGSNSGTG